MLLHQLNELLTRSHPLTIYPLPSSINGYRYFFVNSVFLWNSVSYDVLTIFILIVIDFVCVCL